MVTILLTLAAIRGMRVFTEVYVLTGGGPAGSTDVWMTRVFTTAFERNEIGIASAGSVLLFLLTFVMTVIVQIYRRAKEKVRASPAGATPHSGGPTTAPPGSRRPCGCCCA
ncbi:hypothetical protein ALI22I_06865 [Saccharothrix sp. ALI-22-I]|uniref:carbohydrate ABC transporter permease n=1 Tax=Saccharothrix sp. ALI-22-I TaxID=1933778 RepID=UPI00097C851E|nr:sugar ABC transporter permease [Saccharothrix sp. ALI-22-I]ONI91802.1 hypothetical protein ALI22I_06865 [Saccharothrix sp. ALI-22-I]